MELLIKLFPGMTRKWMGVFFWQRLIARKKMSCVEGIIYLYVLNSMNFCMQIYLSNDVLTRSQLVMFIGYSTSYLLLCGILSPSWIIVFGQVNCKCKQKKTLVAMTSQWDQCKGLIFFQVNNLVSLELYHTHKWFLAVCN